MLYDYLHPNGQSHKHLELKYQKRIQLFPKPAIFIKLVFPARNLMVNQISFIFLKIHTQ